MNCDITTGKFGVAVSGGADSVSLLLSLSSVLSSNPNPLYVITINHNIREENETAGDAHFVQKLCDSLKQKGCKVECKTVVFPRGSVQKTCEERKAGIEEAARYLRYQAFEDFINQNNLDYLCLAHNQNDQLETMLMRFIKGASLEALCGISEQRNKYLRPLLETSRTDIESYLNEQEISWRTDSTNLKTDYERNKIRLKLIPVLNDLFPDWDKSVLSGRKKYEKDSKFIKETAASFEVKYNNGEAFFDVQDLLSLPESIRYRIVLKACNLTGEDARIPFSFLCDFLETLQEKPQGNFTKAFGNIKIIVKKGKVLVKKQNNSNTESDFFDIIEEKGDYSFPFGNLTVTQKEDNATDLTFNGKSVSVSAKLPLIIRSVSMGDTVRTVEGGERKISDIFSDWHVEKEHRCLIPVVQELENSVQNIICIAGAFLGYKDWVIKL